jgi:hypothetical protein
MNDALPCGAQESQCHRPRLSFIAVNKELRWRVQTELFHGPECFKEKQGLSGINDIQIQIVLMLHNQVVCIRFYCPSSFIKLVLVTGILTGVNDTPVLRAVRAIVL